MTNHGFENYGFHNKIYLPDMTEEDIFLGGGSNSGSYNKQSLPNIKGTLTTEGWGGSATGCFTERNSGTNLEASYGYSSYRQIVDFSASRSSSVYKDGANVRPNYYNVDWYIKYK